MSINVTLLLLIVLIALVVQAVVQGIKLFLKYIETKWGWAWPARIFFPRLNAMFWSILLCFAASAGLFKVFDVVLLWPWLDYIVTGIIASQGAGAIYDLVVSWRSQRDKLAVENATKP